MATIILPQWLVINSVPLATPNCLAEDIVPLLGGSADGENRRLPGTNGRRPYRHRQDELVADLTVFLRGDVDDDGAPTANPRATLMALISSLRSSLYTAPATTAGTHAAELHLAGPVVLTAAVQVPRFSPVSDRNPARATLALQVVVPAGAFT